MFGVGEYEGEQTSEDDCKHLIPVQCNDDANGFTSQLTFSAIEGETYYIEIADWLPGRLGSYLQLSVLLEPINSNWDLFVSKPAVPAISRHATVADGNQIYVIGGQTGDPQYPDSGVPTMSSHLLRFDTSRLEGGPKSTARCPALDIPIQLRSV